MHGVGEGPWPWARALALAPTPQLHTLLREIRSEKMLIYKAVRALTMLLLIFTAFLSYSVDAKIPRFRSSLATSDAQIRSTVRMDLLSQCDELWRDTNLDHFTFVGGIMAHGRMPVSFFPPKP